MCGWTRVCLYQCRSPGSSPSSQGQFRCVKSRLIDCRPMRNCHFAFVHWRVRTRSCTARTRRPAFPPPSTAVRLGLGAELILQNQNASSLEDLDFSSDVQTKMIPPFASLTPSRLRAALCAVRGRPGSVRGLTPSKGSKDKTARVCQTHSTSVGQPILS